MNNIIFLRPYFLLFLLPYLAILIVNLNRKMKNLKMWEKYIDRDLIKEIPKTGSKGVKNLFKNSN